jgi:PIN domain
VVDTSSLVPVRLRHDLQQAAQLGAFTAIWSPWIIAELNRVLVWRWIKSPPRGIASGDLSPISQRRCGEAAKTMMQWLLPSFELVNPLPPYPPVWTNLADSWDHPIWAAAKMGQARYIISENTRDYPPRDADGRAVYEGVEYLQGTTFLALLSGPLE